MKKNLLGVVAALLLSSALSCATTRTWPGVYAGIIQTPSGEGINVKVTLNNNETYKVEFRHTGNSEEDFTRSGTIAWVTAKDTIMVGNGKENAPLYFKLGEKALIHLVVDGSIMTGELTSDYILKKQ